MSGLFMALQVLFTAGLFSAMELGPGFKAPDPNVHDFQVRRGEEPRGTRSSLHPLSLEGEKVSEQNGGNSIDHTQQPGLPR